jgi:predicted O-methyltransferase YrrM
MLNLSTLVLPELKNREGLATLMEILGGTEMIEIGVGEGLFARDLLRRWPSFRKYYGIDPWLGDNANDSRRAYHLAVDNLKELGVEKIHLIRNSSMNAVNLFPDNSIDLIYIDARHDFCSVFEELTLYYPKVHYLLLASNSLKAFSLVCI